MAQLTTKNHPVTSLLVFFFSFLFVAPLACFATDTIHLNHPITGANKLVSKGDYFELGFFQPDSKNNQKNYIGIWYHMSKVSNLTAVWEANREAPVRDPNSSQLKISETDGNLVLLNEFKSIVWSTNVSIPSNMSTVAVLLDTGNLQLRSEANSSTIFWQSFDHTTNTVLPGCKMGRNKITNVTKGLVSWKNKVDPAPGIFSTGYDPIQLGTLVWNNSVIYESSGIWDRKNHGFDSVPEMMVIEDNYNYRYYFVDTPQEIYIMFLVVNNSPITRFVLDTSGRLQKLVLVESNQQWLVYWSSLKQCDVYAACGAYGICNQNIDGICSCPEGFREKNPSDWALGDYSGGCTRNEPLQCQGSNSSSLQTDEFQVMLNMRLPSNPHITVNKSDESCKTACLENCSCVAYSYNSECYVWLGDLLNLQEKYNGSDAATLYLRVSPLKSLGTKSKKAVLFLVVGCVLVVVSATLIVILALIWGCRRKLLVKTRNVAAGTIVRFRYFEILYVTKNFSEKIGAGGFGTVFKGALPDSTTIAVKKLQGIQQGEKQFRAEVRTIGTLQHVNLVRLLGFCSKVNKRLLVYEYMPRGSLDTQLFNKSSTVLNWETRISIAIGIARGLSYLHEECREHIIHCDIKPDNILLDESFIPKVADFGLAKLLGRDFSRVLTSMRGTQGYLAPEWIKGITITSKVDVYSYGMMLLEIISGRRNFKCEDELITSLSNFFPTFAAAKLAAGDISSLLDPRMTGNTNLGEVERACKVAFWCIQDEETFRPTMSQVVQMLKGSQDVDMPPIPSLFKNGGEGLEKFQSWGSSESSEISSAPKTFRGTNI